MKPSIVARDLWRSRRGRRVLSGADLDIAAGELVALTGENGSGKSTLIQILAGALRPDAGVVECRSNIGYCPQTIALYDHLTSDEHLALYATAYGIDKQQGRQRAAELLERFGFASDRNKKIVDLSGGTQQKLNLALAVLHDPELLLLDEPYAGFDRPSYLCFIEWLREARERGRAILLVSHLVLETGLFDRALLLADGKIHAAPL